MGQTVCDCMREMYADHNSIAEEWRERGFHFSQQEIFWLFLTHTPHPMPTIGCGNPLQVRTLLTTPVLKSFFASVQFTHRCDAANSTTVVESSFRTVPTIPTFSVDDGTSIYWLLSWSAKNRIVRVGRSCPLLRNHFRSLPPVNYAAWSGSRLCSRNTKHWRLQHRHPIFSRAIRTHTYQYPRR